MNWQTIKPHLIDLGKGLLAAAAMAAVQAIITYLTHFNWGSLLPAAAQAAAAVAAIKVRHV